ncbi:hypothetical protein [Halorhabdus amylolytica]|uniref:hypothetical protein n=1 Tax=Halorhabdus amylolytica TaxID=2559573 RepID=UPI0020BE88B7|nr:hypothetical protein [Halorhabdus amylolytica]
MTENNSSPTVEASAKQSISRRKLLAYTGATLFAGVAGCSKSTNENETTTSQFTPPADSVFEDVDIEGPNLVVTLPQDHDIDRINLIDPDGNLFRQTGVAEGETRAELQIVFKTGGSYTAGEYELVAISGESSASLSVELRPEINVVAVEPELAEDDQNSTGGLIVTLENVGTGPTWIYNIGFRNTPYPNAPEVIEGDSFVDTVFERPNNPSNEFLAPGIEREFLKKRRVLVFSDTDEVSCEGDTAELAVVVQTPHGDFEQPIKATLSGGYHIRDQAAIQHSCENVDIELLDGGGDNA